MIMVNMMVCSCEYAESAVTDSQQGVVLQLWGWGQQLAIKVILLQNVMKGIGLRFLFG
jgi:hypothetical protein